MSVLRTAVLKLDATNEQKQFLDCIVDKIIGRTADILKTFFSLYNKEIDIRNDKKITPNKFPTINGLGEDLYNLIIKHGNSRDIRGPFVLPHFRGEKDKSKLGSYLREMFKSGLLPIQTLVTDIETNYDFAAFKLAHGALKSWDDRNKDTIKNYADQSEKVSKFMVDDAGITLLERWLEKYKLYLSKKVIENFKKFGWSARKMRSYHLEELQSHKDCEDYWYNIFAWKVEQNKLNRMRQSSAFTFPSSSRSIPFGDNAEKFKLSANGRNIVLTIAGREIKVLPSSYFKGDITITSTRKFGKIAKKNGELPYKDGVPYLIAYERGNKSPLPEKVTAEIKEISIFFKNNCYYLALQMNVDVPMEQDKSIKMLEYYSFKNEWEPNVKVMGVDLGINSPAACFVAITGADEGTCTSLSSFIIGESKSKDYCRLMNNLEGRIRNAYIRMDALRMGLRAITPFTPEWLSKTTKMAARVNNIKKQMNQLRRFDIHKHRNFGVSYEQIKFIQLYKKYIGLLQKWSHFGCKPKGKGEISKGFEKHYHRLDMLKLDFRKKVACEIVRHARLNGVNLIVMEDLKEFLPDQENNSSRNELLMIWGSGQIGKWIKHFAEQYGVSVAFVNPDYTSQVDPLTKMFGSRLGEMIKVDRDGEILTMNADRNAAENILRKFLCREANIPVIKAYEIAKDKFALANKNKKDENNLWRNWKIEKLFQNCRLIVAGMPQVINDEDLQALKLGKETKLYRYPDGWQPEEVHWDRKRQKKREWWGIQNATVNKIQPKSKSVKGLNKKKGILTARVA